MGKSEITSKQMVESMIDSMVTGKMTADAAVEKILDTGTETSQDGDLVQFKEGEDIVCPNCGSSNLEEGMVESQDGTKLHAIRCKDCDTGLVESKDADQSESEDDSDIKLVEAEMDENDPHCPKCNSQNLETEMTEGEDGEELLVITCGDCKTRMIVAD